LFFVGEANPVIPEKEGVALLIILEKRGGDLRAYEACGGGEGKGAGRRGRGSGKGLPARRKNDPPCSAEKKRECQISRDTEKPRRKEKRREPSLSTNQHGGEMSFLRGDEKKLPWAKL